MKIQFAPRKRRLECSINVLWLFLTVLWVGLQYVIVVFSDHTHLFLSPNYNLVISDFDTFILNKLYQSRI